MKILRKIAMITCFLIYALGTFLNVQGKEAAADVYVINLHGEVNDAMASYLERELDIAYQNNQKAIIDIDTWGGFIISAESLSNILLNSPVETTAFVSGKAISAGVIITISCDNVSMAPTAVIGAAEPIPYSEKVLSAWKGLLSTASEQNNRPVDVINAMADSRIVIEGYSKDDDLLTLTASQALDLGVSDAICSSVDEAIDFFDLGETYEIAKYTLSDGVASAITSTVALTLFFILGFAFMILEIFTAGFGVAGVISIICFALYFFGGFLAGSAQWWAAALFILGIIALVVEMFIPGFGVFGISGLVLCVLALVFSSNSIDQFARRAGIALSVCVVLIPIFIKIFGKIKMFDRIANKEMQTVGQGYVINQVSDEIVGKTGIAVTELRPIGVIEVEDKRMDAFSEEGFIAKGSEVVITGKKSSSVVVRKTKQN
ncbi:MAG: NfeD family protein [Eubacteriales bacterium]